MLKDKVLKSNRTGKYQSHPPLQLQAKDLLGQLVPVESQEDMTCYFPPASPTMGTIKGEYWFIRRKDYQGYVHVFLWIMYNGYPLDYRPRLQRTCPTRGCHNPAHYVESSRAAPSSQKDLLQYLPEDL